jgi:hypothetical protein
MSKKREVVLRCLDHYINYLQEKQRENKKRGFPGIINEDIEKKIEGLNALKQTWNPSSEDRRIDMKYYKYYNVRFTDKLSSRVIEID